ncbi:hypothetical protein [Streptomyces sp. WMMC897]|nr:hypothetical protein [Streptomyces sp. WMMC897]MCZ7414763.1 hypothetical protein [Streptomyces sp. WMMC897]
MGSRADPVLVLAAGLELGWHCGKTLAAVEWLAAGEKLAVTAGTALTRRV